MKLEIELVPKTCWYNNLRKVLPRKEWDKLRKEVYKKAEYRCEICGSTGKLNCHEKYSYDDNKLVQKLEGFVALCDNCHYIKHIGFVNVQIAEGKLPGTIFCELEKHFAKVNECCHEDFKEHIRKAFEIWKRRSRKNWRTDLGEYINLIK